MYSTPAHKGLLASYDPWASIQIAELPLPIQPDGPSFTLGKSWAMHGEIANQDLKQSDVPPSNAGWHESGRFSLTFNGYEWWGSFEKCADIANRAAETFRESGSLPESLTELRTCLFFEQRRWHHFGFDPDEEAMNYISALVEEIRRSVRQ